MDAFGMNGFGEPGKTHNNQWQQVTNVKKQRLDAKRKEKAVSGAGSNPNARGSAGTGGEGSVFSALDEAQGEKVRNRVAARQAAIEQMNGDEEEEEDNENGVRGEGAEGAGEPLETVKAKKVKKPKVSVADAAAIMDVENLSSFLAEMSESFVDVPEGRLMRCADYFARAFSTVTTAHFQWHKLLRDLPPAKAVEVPLCDVPDPVIQTTSEWLAKQPSDELGKFMRLLLKMSLEDPAGASHQQKKGGAGADRPLAPTKAKVGMLVILAILIRKKPDVFLQEAEAIRGSPDFAGNDRLPTLVWACGQVAQADLPSAVWVWSRNLLPLAVGKQSTPLARDAVLTFFESIICKNLAKARTTLLNASSKRGERVVPPAALDAVMHATFVSETAQTKASERFKEIYPLVRDVALAGSGKSKNTKPAAISLLPLSLAAAAQEPPALSQEACLHFVWCLAQNNDCYKQWEKHHLDQLHGSTRILTHMLHTWQHTHVQLLPLDQLRKSLQVLRKKHAEVLQEAGDSSSSGGSTNRNRGEPFLKLVRKADQLCKTLLAKSSWTRKLVPSCFKASATLAVVAAMAYGCYLLSPDNNPWGWDGLLLLSKTHPII
eukprot:TRINITY_DN7278_c0_g1_i1.p1 TRINITY_DN7278_c0_g1~~TRINITY_DN7278_c0_g1_i1.p1  ORF type:complete len:603 (+),score=137.84 TRINITY_DN7278_c0_g1_i1:263-2071(+)